MAEHLELQGADGGQDRRRVAGVGIAQHLDDAFLVELLEPAAELLGPAGVERARRGEDLGREPGDRRERDGRAVVALRVDRVAELQAGGVDEADDVAGVGLLDRLAVGAERRRRVLRRQLPSGAIARHRHAPLEAARADAGEGQPVAVRRVHVRLDLEHERREPGVERPGDAVDVASAATATARGRRRRRGSSAPRSWSAPSRRTRASSRRRGTTPGRHRRRWRRAGRPRPGRPATPPPPRRRRRRPAPAPRAPATPRGRCG